MTRSCRHSALSLGDDFVVVRCSDEPQEIFTVCDRLLPCVLIIGQGLAERTERESLSRLADFGRRVQVLVELEEDDVSSEEFFLRLGCMGYLPPGTSESMLRRAVDCVASGELWARRKLISRMLRESLSEERDIPLTEREKEILRLMSDGLKNREISEQLHISHQTVRWHQRNLYSKIGVHDRLQALPAMRRVVGRVRPEKVAAAG